MSFTDKSLKTIELDTVLNLLSANAVCEGARELCLTLSPVFEEQQVSELVNQTTAACSIMTYQSAPPFSAVKNIVPALHRADLGGSLNTLELLEICAVLRSARVVRATVSERKEPTCIDYLFNALHTNRSLEDRIGTSITGENELADSASPELADIRRRMRAAASRAREELNRIISAPSYAKALQENIITTRAGRYVVPVKVEYKSQIPGLVHDVSSTGATLFVEPMAVVKANNELRELAAEEKTEIERILAELSAECAQYGTDIESDYYTLVRLDFIFAKAKYSYAIDGVPAGNNGRQLVLRHARHPLIDRNRVVPIDLEFGEGCDSMIVTGPNTGGKTVTLKTIGLLAAMNQCGLHIPASDGSVLPVFSRILADIGDEQSIEQNLSTFSAHMANIVNITTECDGRSLVLFDELGAGTDPAEGAALAIAIIEHIRSRGAVCVATTHYTELKVYASNETGVVNASCEFNVDTLKPTYKLLVGIPGKSNAFAISGRLGLDSSIIEAAGSRISSGAADFEMSIERLEKARLQLENDRELESAKLREAEEKLRKASMLKAEYEVRLEKAEIKARRESDRILDEARSTAEEVFQELDLMRSRINEEEDARRVNDARNELRRRLNSAKSTVKIQNIQNNPDTPEPSRPAAAGDVVLVKKLGMKAEVLSVSKEMEYTLKCGAMIMNASAEEILLLEGEKPKTEKSSASSGVRLQTVSASSEIDLRGMDSIEAVAAAEQFIDNAVMGKLTSVYIIHGKGTGTLRKAIHQMLRKNRSVKKFRLGNFGEGEDGVTIAEL